MEKIEAIRQVTMFSKKSDKKFILIVSCREELNFYPCLKNLLLLSFGFVICIICVLNSVILNIFLVNQIYFLSTLLNRQKVVFWLR